MCGHSGACGHFGAGLHAVDKDYRRDVHSAGTRRAPSGGGRTYTPPPAVLNDRARRSPTWVAEIKSPARRRPGADGAPGYKAKEVYDLVATGTRACATSYHGLIGVPCKDDCPGRDNKDPMDNYKAV